MDSELLREFRIVRKNALANPNLYDGRYCQKDFKEAYNAYLDDTLALLNKSLMKLAKMGL